MRTRNSGLTSSRCSAVLDARVEAALRRHRLVERQAAAADRRRSPDAGRRAAPAPTRIFVGAGASSDGALWPAARRARRRLGVSPTLAFTGPVIATLAMCGWPLARSLNERSCGDTAAAGPRPATDGRWRNVTWQIAASPALTANRTCRRRVGLHSRPLPSRRRLASPPSACGRCRRPPTVNSLHALAVEADLELVRFGEPHDPADEVAQQVDLDAVLAVDREVVTDHRAAARAERHPFEPVVLRQVGRDLVGIGLTADRRIADRLLADLARRLQIALEQRRRDTEDVADVVEAVARVVWRQQCRDVDVEPEQIANRVVVLGAVEAMERRAATGIGLGVRRLVELVLEPAGETVVGDARRGEADPRAASRRRAASARPSPRRRLPW